MTIIERIQQLFGVDLDEERLISISRTCSEMMAPLLIDLELLENDQKIVNVLQSKRKEAQEKIRETGIRAHYAIDLYNQHLDIELKKISMNQAFNIPLILNESSILGNKVIKSPDDEGELNIVDHVECALINAQKAYEESIVWMIFYAELEELEKKIKEAMIVVNTKNTKSFTPSETLSINTYVHDCHRIFTDLKGRQLFEYLQANLVSPKNPLAAYTFIFRRMQRDGYIYQDIKEKPFRDFLSRHFDIEINYKLKPEGYNVTDLKERIYSNAISSLY